MTTEYLPGCPVPGVPLRVIRDAEWHSIGRLTAIWAVRGVTITRADPRILVSAALLHAVIRAAPLRMWLAGHVLHVADDHGAHYVYVLDAYDPERDTFTAHWPD